MDDHRPPDVDDRIRAAYGTDPGSAARVALAALAAGRRSRRPWMAVAAAVAIAIVATALTWRPWQPSAPGREPAGSDVMSLPGSFNDGLLVMSLPDGSVSIIGGDAREDRPPDGSGMVLVEGEFK